MTIYPLHALRAVALRTQSLHSANAAGSNLSRGSSNRGSSSVQLHRTQVQVSRPADRAPTPDALYEVVNQLGCVQIDTINVVRRSHYLVLWSRLGNYDPTDLDDLSSPADRRLFEGWQHAACYIPLAEYRYQMPHQRNLREHPTNWYNRWLNELVQKDLVPQVLERVRREGALKVGNFESDGHKGGTWWNWRPAKVALEFLYAFGELMIAERVKFQKVYDLTERVLPEWVDTSEPTPEERDRFWVARGAKALGVCTARQAGDYIWMKVSRSKPHVESLIKDGTLVPIQGQLANGKTTDLLVHHDNLSLLQQAADGSLRAQHTTFLSPFDSLFWATRRDEMIWGFHQALEAYVPAPKRVYGYFCLPILHKDRLVGRFDPKLERQNGTLRLKALYLEPGVEPDEELVAGVVDSMHDFLVFHNAKDLVIERSEPAAFGKKLLKGI